MKHLILLLILLMATSVEIKGIIDDQAEDIFIQISPASRVELKRQVTAFESKVKREDAKLMASVNQFKADTATLSKARQAELLGDQAKNVVGMFSEYQRNIMIHAKTLSYKIQQEVFNSDIEKEFGFDDITLYTWQAVFVRTCPSCIELHGTTKTRAEWERLGTPKVFPTVCNGHCQCILMPTEAMPNKAEMRRPVQVEATRIRRAEIKRGKDYSPSYRSQILGNLNNEEFRKSLRKLNIKNSEFRKLSKVG